MLISLSHLLSASSNFRNVIYCLQGCSSHFSSLMGYQYHQKRCGGDLSDDEKSVFLCQHCGKSYRSKTGRDYHVRTEHSPSNNITMESTKKDNIPDTNNNTGKERVWSTESLICTSLVPLLCFLVCCMKTGLKHFSYQSNTKSQDTLNARQHSESLQFILQLRVWRESLA